jgi:hypothetical protein
MDDILSYTSPGGVWLLAEAEAKVGLTAYGSTESISWARERAHSPTCDDASETLHAGTSGDAVCHFSPRCCTHIVGCDTHAQQQRAIAPLAAAVQLRDTSNSGKLIHWDD